jgi:putative photosynthetic complex assembly protein
MSDPFDNVPFPHWPLRAAAAMAVIALIAASAVRIAGVPPGPHISSPVKVERDLHFVDRNAGGVGAPAGGIDVIDAHTNRKIDELRPGEDGFIRATLRGLARERKRRGLGPEVPFRLALHTDGRLTLEDPAISRTLELEAFGSTNSGAFLRLLTAGERTVAAAAPAN